MDEMQYVIALFGISGIKIVVPEQVNLEVIDNQCRVVIISLLTYAS